MPRFNSINFYQNRLKIKLFLPKKYKFFERLELRPVDPSASGGEGFALRPPVVSETALSL